MKSTFLVSIDHGTDTDLLGIAQELQDIIESNSSFQLTEDVRPWHHPTLPSTNLAAPTLPTPPDVSGL